MSQTLLVPTDGSKTSERAADRAIDLANHLDADVHSIFVVSAPQVGFAPPNPDLEPLFASGTEYVSRIRDKVEDAGISCKTEVFEADHPHDGIIAYVEDHDIDYIVMGTHGQSALSRIFLGSVTERVLKASPVPVIAVPPSERELEETTDE